MQANREIACGYNTIAKESVAEFWNTLANEVNSAGPPVKTVNEWKKVWTDQKRYVRRKAGRNMQTQRGTGGGPNQTQKLTSVEQCIYELVGMKESVEGVEDSCVFGLPGSFENNDKENQQPPNVTSFEEIVVQALIEEPTSSHNKNETMLTSKDREKPTCSSKAAPHSLKRKTVETQGKLTTADFLDKELKSQEILCSKLAEISDCVQAQNKQMEASMKRMYRSLEKSNDLKLKKLNELKRHHEVCEKMRMEEVQSKIERNKRMLEIEEIKLEILQRREANK